MFAVATLQPLAIYSKANNPGVPDTLALNGNGVTGIVMVVAAGLPHPTTIGALLAAIGIAGMDGGGSVRGGQHRATAVEVAGDIDTLLLDKTGTVTVGNRRATQFVPLTAITPPPTWDGWLARLTLEFRGPDARRQEHPRSWCSPNRSKAGVRNPASWDAPQGRSSPPRPG